MLTGELVQQGAEARIYFLDYVGFPAVCKERFTKTYRHPQLDESLTKSRMKAEVKAINHLKSKSAFLSKSLPTVLGVSSSSIVMTRITNAKTFQEAISSGPFDLCELFQRVGDVIGEIHKSGLVHGDLTTTNFLVKNDKSAIVPIDFGLSSFSSSAEDRAVDLYVLERSLLTSGRDDSDLFANFLLKAYRRKMENLGESIIKGIIDKLDDVRARGRKRDMVG